MTNKTCELLVIHCLDWRLQSGLHEWLREKGYQGKYDQVAVAGGAKDLVSSASAEKKYFLIEQIDNSVFLHNIQKVFLIHHNDCGAYGGRAAFASDTAEKIAHLTDMEIAQEIIETKYPQLTVENYYAQLNEDNNEWRVTIERV